ncbi:MAG: hypothetical protein LBE13_00335 [Bacteroidales bacterium]|jgi:hypothetical protein|nr:hypothetical protein [Bacteroidales bacterium]
MKNYPFNNQISNGFNFSELYYNLKNYCPIQLDDLVRIGRNFNGGYVLSTKSIEVTETLLSFGINDDWSFEKEFTKRKECKLYAYDYSVSLSRFKKDKEKFFRHMLFNLFFLRVKTGQMYHSLWKYYDQLSEGFAKFFNNPEHFFFEKYIGQYDDEKFVCFDTIINDYALFETKDFSIFIKMDIEGNEYRVLPDIISYSNKINGLVIEFHMLDIIDKRFERIMADLMSHFYIAHVHANNAGGLIHKTHLPKLLEITFINKSLVAESVMVSKFKYPIEGLDFPNINNCKDIELDFGRS